MNQQSFHRHFWKLNVLLVKLCVISIYMSLLGCAFDKFIAIENKFPDSHWHLQGEHYQVKPGDTLFGIALQVDKDFRQLAKVNNIAAPYLIFPGQNLTLVGEGSAPVTEPDIPSKVKAQQTSNKSHSPTITSKPPKPEVGKTPKKGPNSKHILWTWPLKGTLVAKFSTKSPLNKGIDIQGRLGQSVRAAAAGKVVFAGEGPRGYGRLVIIDHNSQYLSAYANNHNVLVKENDQVQAQQAIAHLRSDDSQKARLHFEVRRRGKPLDPLKLLPANG